MKQTHPDNIEKALAMLKQSADENVFKDWKVTDSMKTSLIREIQRETTVESVRQTYMRSKIAVVGIVASVALALIFVPPLYRSSVHHSLHTTKAGLAASQSESYPKSQANGTKITQANQITNDNQNVNTINSKSSVQAKVSVPKIYINGASQTTANPPIQNTGGQGKLVAYNVIVSNIQKKDEGNAKKTGQTQVMETQNAQNIQSTQSIQNAQIQNSIDQGQGIQALNTTAVNQPTATSLGLSMGISNSAIVHTLYSPAKTTAKTTTIDPSKLEQLKNLVNSDYVIAGQVQNGIIPIYKVSQQQPSYLVWLPDKTMGIYVTPSQQIPVQLTDSEWQMVVQTQKIKVLFAFKAISSDSIPKNAIQLSAKDIEHQTIWQALAKQQLYGVQLPTGAILLLTTKPNQPPYKGSILTAWPDAKLVPIVQVQDPFLYFPPEFSPLSWQQLHPRIIWLTMSQQAFLQLSQK